MVARLKSDPIPRRRLLTAVAGLWGEVRWHEPLRDLTSFRIGGPADVLVIPADVEDLCQLVRQARMADVPLFMLGGTNLLIPDEGLAGVVVHLSKFTAIRDEADDVVYAEAGLKMPALLRHTVSRSLSGLEWAAGIPGTVGGAVVMNAGTRLGEMKDSLKAIRSIDLKGQVKTHAASTISFGYRRASVPKGIVVGAWFQLKSEPRKKVETAIKTYLHYRKTTQPLTRPNAGCVFKNPTQMSAGQLIEESGLKGVRVGDAQVSQKHANFIVNVGQARATDVMMLIKKIQQTVAKRTGIALELELKIVGNREA